MNNAEYINEKLPNGWDEIPAKFLVSTPIKTGAGAEALEYDKDKIRYIRITDFDKNGNIDESKKASLPKEEGLKNILNDGDVLAATAGATVGKSMLFSGLNEPCAYAGYLARFDTDREKLNNKFLLYYLQSPILDSFKAVAIAQSTIENISASKYANMKIIVPPINTQNEIVEYLDKKCEKINNYKLKHNQIIEKLEEYRKSIIAETVTKGLDSNTKMKESQTYWIDEIPISWNIVPLKTRFEFGKGLSITKADLVEKGLPVISYGQIHSKNCSGVHITRDLIRYVPEEYSLYKDSFAKKNDFIFADTSEDLEGCGNCIYVDNNGVYAGYHTVLLSSKYNDNNKYLGYLFRTDIWRYQIRTKLTEVKLYSITQGCLKQIEILLPSTDEQNDIVEYLDKKCLAIDKLISKQKESIEKLEEYKKSLIYNVITGKMEVK